MEWWGVHKRSGGGDVILGGGSFAGDRDSAHGAWVEDAARPDDAAAAGVAGPGVELDEAGADTGPTARASHPYAAGSSDAAAHPRFGGNGYGADKSWVVVQFAGS